MATEHHSADAAHLEAEGAYTRHHHYQGHDRATKRPRRSSNDNDNNNNHDDALGGGDGDLDNQQPLLPYACNENCYDEVMKGIASTANGGGVRHHWFHSIATIRAADLDIDRSHPAHNCSDTMASLTGEIDALQRQLSLVKRRFPEASQRCADAVCASYDHPFAQSTASDEFWRARQACNPYEVLGETKRGGLNHGLFLNRSAVKLANMDAMLQWSFTAAQQRQQQLVFQFVDLCAAPGGFSEYLIRRFCHSTAEDSGSTLRGYGMSLVGRNEHGSGTPWKLVSGPMLVHVTSTTNTTTAAATRSSSHNPKGGGGVVYHISHGADGTGDILKWPNVLALQQEIQTSQQQLQQQQQHVSTPGTTTTAPTGKVPLVVADGGVDAQRDVDCQEGMTQKLVVCQVAAALALLQQGGTFVIKLFGFQTHILQTVLWELFLAFDSLAVLKPVSSRPASAERYLVCRGYHGVPPITAMSIMTNYHSSERHNNGGIMTNDHLHNNNNNNALLDGPRWISQVLVGRPSPHPNASALRSRLALFLQAVDRDMLQLNLQACFAILSHLDAKCMRLTSAARRTTRDYELDDEHDHSADHDMVVDHGNQDDYDYEEDQWMKHHHGPQQHHHHSEYDYHHHHHRQAVKVDVEQYRIAWKLF